MGPGEDEKAASVNRNAYRPLDASAAWMDSLAVMPEKVIQEQLTVQVCHETIFGLFAHTLFQPMLV